MPAVAPKASELQTGLFLQLVQKRMSLQEQGGLEHTILNKMNEEINRMIIKKKEEAQGTERPICAVKRYKDLAIRETKLEKFLKYLEGFEFG